ncbi:ATP-binding protein [Sunxiuqinia sp. sy24]|uniref:ATP-binding protein n=1 Tax=Sunxiuqinia sp. sy24 TaxID=3461495 RepID=UPI0040458757
MRDLFKILTFVLFVISMPAKGSKLNFAQYKMKDGLSFNNVDFLAEDDEGLIYACTNLGLNVFDGSDFAIYNQYNTEGFGNKVSVVLPFEKGYVLIGTVEKGLFLFDKFKEKIIPLYTNERQQLGWVTDMKIDADQNIWIGIEDGKLYCVTSEELIRRYKKGEALRLSRISQIPPLRINSLVVMDQGILLGNDGPDVYRVRKSGVEFIVDSPLQTKGVQRVYKIFREGKSIFIGTDHGLFRLDNYELLSYNEKYTLNKTWQMEGRIVRSISVYLDDLWIGTEGQGLFKIPIDTQEKTSIEQFVYSSRRKNGITSNYILSSLVDTRGNLWIGTWFSGINKLDLKEQSHFFIYDQKNENDIFSNITWCLEKGSNDFFWLGTHGNGLCKYQLGEGNFQQINQQPGVQSVSSLLFDDSRKLLYVGTWGNGIRIFDEPKMNGQENLETEFAVLKDDRIYSILMDHRQNIWIGSFKNGLHYYNQSKKELTKVDLKNDMADVRFLALDTVRNSMWVASFGQGLFVLDFTNQWTIERTQHFKKFEGCDEQMKLTSLYLDKQGKLWILSTDGLGYFDEEKQKPVKLELLGGSIVTGMTEDSKGSLWVSTYKGIFKIDKESYEIESMLTNYAFHSINYNSEYNTILATSDEGLVRISPNYELRNKRVPEIRLSGLKLLDQEIAPKTKLKGRIILPKHINYCDTIIIPHFSHTFSIRLNALSFSRSQQERIGYKLDNFDEIWNEQAGISATAVYTNVPPGKYILRVKVANEKNEWSEERELVIIKLSPWWATNLALLIYFLIVVGIIYIIIREVNLRIRFRQELKIEKIKQEREFELYQEKAVFFTNISHDLRTPLTLIVGPLEEMLDSKQFNEKVEQTLQRMLKNARMLLKLINQILDFRKAETNNLSLSVKKIKLNEFLKNIYYQFNELAQNKNIDFELLCPDESTILVADPLKIESVLFNLLSNALKFTAPYGSILVEYKEEADSIRLIVSDTGIGMDEKELPNIFNRFYQLKPSGSSLGTGIGLNLVKRYVDLHRGKIEIESSLGKGTSFYIDLPKYADTSSFDEFFLLPTQASLEETDEGWQHNGHEKKGQVLVVIDDHQDILDYLTDILSPVYRVYTALDGKSGLSLVARKNPNLVISDIMMEDMDGFAVCKQIKTNLNTSHIPVILLTSKGTIEDRIEGFDKGADEYIQKPFNSKLLLTRIRTLIEHRQLLRKRFLLSDLQTAEPAPSSVDEGFMKRIVEIVDKNMTDSDFTVQSLVDEMKVSQDQLYRKIKALTGLSINHFIRLLRLKRAARMLASGQYSVSEVVFQTGFNNPSYFTKCFKAEYGVLPSDYVQKVD